MIKSNKKSKRVFGEPHPGEEKRRTITAIVQRKSDGKFLIVKWKKFGWIAPVIGGIDDDESAEKAAEREVFEETGYKVKALMKVGEESEMHFFAENKNVWRHKIDQPVLLELLDEMPEKINEEENQKLEAVWMDSNELMQKITHEYNKLGFIDYINGVKLNG